MTHAVLVPSPALSPAAFDPAQLKARVRRRAGQRGAIVFIVAMTLSVLASLGLFALVSASTEVKTAGYERQALQTHYLAEYGIMAAASKVGPDYAQAVEAQMRVVGTGGKVGDYDPTFPRKHCVSLESVPTTADVPSRECKILRMPDLTQGWTTPNTTKYGRTFPEALRTASGTTPGSLGPSQVILDGYFTVEITDPLFGQPVAGMAVLGQQLASTCPVTFTVTSFGQTFPSSGPNAAAIYGSSGLEQGRGRLTGGPIPCPQ